MKNVNPEAVPENRRRNEKSNHARQGLSYTKVQLSMPFRHRRGFAARFEARRSDLKGECSTFPVIKVTKVAWHPRKRRKKASTSLGRKKARLRLGILPRTGAGHHHRPPTRERQSGKHGEAGNTSRPPARTREASARQAHAGATSRRGLAGPAPLKKTSENPAAQEPFAYTVRRWVPH